MFEKRHTEWKEMTTVIKLKMNEFTNLKGRKKSSAFNKNQKGETLHCNKRDRYKCLNRTIIKKWNIVYIMKQK